MEDKGVSYTLFEIQNIASVNFQDGFFFGVVSVLAAGAVIVMLCLVLL